MTASLYRAICRRVSTDFGIDQRREKFRSAARPIAWTDLAELAEGRASPLDSKNAEAASGER